MKHEWVRNDDNPLPFHDCLFVIGWNTGALANAIEYDIATVTAWETDTSPVPEEIAICLEKLAALHWQLGLPVPIYPPKTSNNPVQRYEDHTGSGISKRNQKAKSMSPALTIKNHEITAGELISAARHARSPLAPWDNDVTGSEVPETKHPPKDPSGKAAPRTPAHHDLPTMQQLKAVRHRQANEIKQKEAIRQGRQISPSNKGKDTTCF